MGKFNRALVFSAPLIIYALGLWGSRQALIGTIVYMVWIFMELDEAEYKTKKSQSGGTDQMNLELYGIVGTGVTFTNYVDALHYASLHSIDCSQVFNILPGHIFESKSYNDSKVDD